MEGTIKSNCAEKYIELYKKVAELKFLGKAREVAVYFDFIPEIYDFEVLKEDFKYRDIEITKELVEKIVSKYKGYSEESINDLIFKKIKEI